MKKHIPILLCFLLLMSGCSQKNNPADQADAVNSGNDHISEVVSTDETNNVFLFSEDDISLYGVEDTDGSAEYIVELLKIYSENAAIVDSSVSMYYSKDNGEYIPNDGEKLLVVDLEKRTNVMFFEDDVSFDNVVTIIILPEQMYIGFETDDGKIRTYGLSDSEDIRQAKEIMEKFK